jgi:hypothetical protein
LETVSTTRDIFSICKSEHALSLALTHSPQITMRYSIALIASVIAAVTALPGGTQSRSTVSSPPDDLSVFSCHRELKPQPDFPHPFLNASMKHIDELIEGINIQTHADPFQLFPNGIHGVEESWGSAQVSIHKDFFVFLLFF